MIYFSLCNLSYILLCKVVPTWSTMLYYKEAVKGLKGCFTFLNFFPKKPPSSTSTLQSTVQIFFFKGASFPLHSYMFFSGFLQNALGLYMDNHPPPAVAPMCSMLSSSSSRGCVQVEKACPAECTAHGQSLTTC